MSSTKKTISRKGLMIQVFIFVVALSGLAATIMEVFPDNWFYWVAVIAWVYMALEELTQLVRDISRYYCLNLFDEIDKRHG